jgi:hypothetical protein
MRLVRTRVAVRSMFRAAVSGLMLVGCASAGGAPRDVASGGSSAGKFPLPKGDATEIDALPGLSAFAWVPPSLVFSGVSPEDDERAMSVRTAELRDASSAVLRANGWRETSPDSASFVLALVDVERTVMREEKYPDPRSDMTQPSVCANLPPAQRQVCREPPPRTYPPIIKVMPFNDHRVVFAIVRVHDQARRTWLVPIDGMNTIARGTVNLLKAQAP